MKKRAYRKKKARARQPPRSEENHWDKSETHESGSGFGHREEEALGIDGGVRLKVTLGSKPTARGSWRPYSAFWSQSGRPMDRKREVAERRSVIKLKVESTTPCWGRKNHITNRSPGQKSERREKDLEKDIEMKKTEVRDSAVPEGFITDSRKRKTMSTFQGSVRRHSTKTGPWL